MTIGEAIYKVRVLKGLTTTELAAQTGLSAGYISMLENNKRIPSLNYLRAICTALDVPATLLVMLTEANHPAISPYMPLIYQRIIEGKTNEQAHV